MARRNTSHIVDTPHDPVCRFCRRPLVSRPDFGGSPGCKERTFYGPDESDWCPNAGGGFPSYAEWHAYMNGKPLDLYAAYPYQYHALKHASLRAVSAA